MLKALYIYSGDVTQVWALGESRQTVLSKVLAALDLSPPQLVCVFCAELVTAKLKAPLLRKQNSRN